LGGAKGLYNPFQPRKANIEEETTRNNALFVFLAGQSRA
jgi:hypothetical protein